MRLVIAALLLAVFLYPKTTFAEIATVHDWIGLFPINAPHNKASTLHGCPALDQSSNHLCWAYTSSCTQTAGSTPFLSRLATQGTYQACTFTVPFPQSNPFVFRVYANDWETPEALISTSNQFFINTVATSVSAKPSGILYSVAKITDTNGTVTQNGDLTINDDIALVETGVIFVDGNLYINHNLENDLPTKGLVFVVKGAINIERSVTKVNAFLIAYSGFCSAWDNVTSTCEDYKDAEIPSRQYLTINGSVISLNAGNAPQFKRLKANPNPAIKVPAETINYQPKYLIIMKDIFSRDLKIWQEIQ